MNTNSFLLRHIGPRKEDVSNMLATMGLNSIDELIEQTIPSAIRLKEDLDLGKALSEQEFLAHIKELAQKNKQYKTYIGLGYNNAVLPSVIQRNILENPGWYTAYTPYQAEISQGRLEALLNFQTMVIDLTGMEIANASLLDEATAASEAMMLLYNSRPRAKKKANANQFFISEDCLPQTISLLETRSEPLGIELIIGDHREFEFNEKIFGALLQYPTATGEIYDYKNFTDKAHEVEAGVAVAADLLSLALLESPGSWGADVVIGTSQRFGIPMGYGGPHAAYFATKEAFKRNVPGRIIGLSKDEDDNPALRMALQTREQHIKREKATSNICTAQVLLAVMAGMYAVFHGPKGITHIAKRIHNKTNALSSAIKDLGYIQQNEQYFDTIQVDLKEISADAVNKIALEAHINFLYIDEHTISISLNETTTIDDLNDILAVLAAAKGIDFNRITEVYNSGTISESLKRKTDFMTHKVFNSYHSETEMMRYIKKLERKDLSLNHSMIALGSCTMKLNAASEMLPLNESNFSSLHPFIPEDQSEGYLEIFKQLEIDLCEITGFAGMSLQPNSGAQGEYAGLMVIREYHRSRGDHQRNITLIPSSAHGTNPASAVMAGMKVVVVKCDQMGNIDIDDLREKAEKHANELSALMITYPSTHGVFEASVKEITSIIHKYGGQVYMDGANMNAQVGLTSPGEIGADVCHLNLHKTFAIPHGGGGPGVGPIGVAEQLVEFLPGHPVIACGGKNSISAVSAAPWGSALVLLISYAYIKMLGTEGLTESTRYAILNANYMKAVLEKHYKILYTGKNNRVAHEMILECRDLKAASGIDVTDIAKRLMDYGYHAPTVSFPVAGTLMIEPTESESKEEIDRFCEAMISIREEIENVITGEFDSEDNTLKNAPHTLKQCTSDEWMFGYSRHHAAYPLDWVRENKFWPAVRRVDQAYGDRNLICSCPGIESYEDSTCN
nr:aminomethyl-transferring glycine dehydrogenase [Flavobacteriales bacterium]